MSDDMNSRGSEASVSQQNNQSGPVGKKSALTTLGILLFAGIIIAITFLPGYCQDQLRQNGLPGTAVITAVRDTGNRFNDQPEVEFQLDVNAPGLSPYKATTRMYISPVYLPQFQPGRTINVKYDPKDQYRIAIVSVEN